MARRGKRTLETCGWCTDFREHKRPLYYGEGYCRKKRNYTVSGDTCESFR